MIAQHIRRQLVTATLLAATKLFAAKEAHVTQVVRDVNLLEKKADAHPAALNDPVREGEAVRTGDRSRSELTFADLTITRLGANSLFSFTEGGRDVQLNSGSILLRVPKDSGGASIHSSAVTVAVTGTTLILESARSGASKLFVLEGGAQLSLVKYRNQSRRVRAGQMLDVPAGAKTLPQPVDIDLNQLMRTHPLIADFPPLPSQPLIVAAANQQRPSAPIYQGQPVQGQPVSSGANLPPWIPIPILTGGSGPIANNPPTRGGTQPGGGRGRPQRGGTPGTTTTSRPTTTQAPPSAPSPMPGRTAGSAAPPRPTKRPTPRVTPTPPVVR